MNIELHDNASFGARFADAITAKFGSIAYLVVQTVAIVIWILINAYGHFVAHWDPYPFILLNLIFSTQAAYAAPLILLSQNRASDHDRRVAESDWIHNQRMLLIGEAIARKLGLDPSEFEVSDQMILEERGDPTPPVSSDR